MPAKDVTVRLSTLDGVWEVGGVDRRRGIVPENVRVEADRWGPSKASFDLRRDPVRPWPDLGAYTPVEIEIGGVVVWDGRIAETPSRSGGDMVINCQCVGWQYHLDDDLYERTYVHTRMADWRDMRSLLEVNLALAWAAPVISTDGTITINIPNGTVVPAGARAGVVLDVGVDSEAKRVVVDYETSANDASASIYFTATDGDDVGAVASDSSSPTGLNTGSGTKTHTFTTTYRKLFIYFHRSATVTYTGDVWIKLTSIKVFTDAAYESGNESILKAPVVIEDALDRGTLLLSADRSQIDPDATITFNIPDLAPDGPKTPREIWDGVNAWHDYQSKIDIGRRPVFRPQPAAPRVKVGAWSPMEDEDPSANSGEEIYNRVLVTGQTPAGEPVRVERTAGQQSDARVEVLSNPAPNNPSFDTNTTSWTGVTRDTASFDSAPASGAIAAGATAVETFTGTFAKGKTYALSFAALITAGGLVVTFGDHAAGDIATYRAPLIDGVWTGGYAIAWTPRASRTGVTVRFTNDGSASANIDSLALKAANPTLVDRRNFRRTKELQVRSALPSDGAAAAQIGDVWLQGHKLTPFKGSVKIVGDEAVREILTDASVPAERLLLMTGELLRFDDRLNPDDGSHGRDGRMANVAYEANTNELTVALDNTRSNFEALLNRLDVVSNAR
jgi:hypothetical protein